jgi:hypothetical protein
MTNKTALMTLKFASAITILTGFICILACHPHTQGTWLWLTDLLTWPLDGSPSTFREEAFILNAVLGGVMMGWGSLMLSLVDEILVNPKLIMKIQTSLLIWFFCDSTGSYFAKVPGNIVLNVVFLITFLIPLNFLRKNHRI